MSPCDPAPQPPSTSGRLVPVSRSFGTSVDAEIVRQSMNTRQWHIGNATITAIVEVEEYGPVAGGALDYIPDASEAAVRELRWPWENGWVDADDQIPWSNQSLLVQDGDTTVLIDTCVGNNKPRALDFNRLETDFMERLVAAGGAPEDVDFVLCTHLHIDHVGWNTTLVDGAWVPTFPDSTYFFVEKEYEHWRDFAADPNAESVYVDDFARDNVDGKAVYADSVAPVVDAGLVKFVSAGDEILPGIRLVASPGHTPGHVCVEIESAGAKAVITGDSMHSPLQISYPEWSAVLDTDMEGSAESRKRMIQRWADEEFLVIGTHFGGKTAGYVIREGERFGLS